MRKFALLVASAGVSGLGDGVTRIAGSLLAVSLTRSPVQIAGLAIAQLTATAVLALPAGAVADRVDRRAAMVTACLVRVAGVGGLAAWLLAGHPSLLSPMLVLYAVYLAMGLAGLIYENAATAVLPVVVEHARLERANGRLRSAEGLSASFAAQPLGALLYTIAAPVPFLLDAAGLLVVAGLSSRLPCVAGGAGGGSMRGGLRWLIGSPQLRAVALTTAMSNVGLGAVFSMFVLIARVRLGVGAFGYSALLTAIAAGGLAGGLIAGRVVERIGRMGALRCELVTEALTYAGLLLSRNVIVAGVLLAFLSLQLAIFSSVSATMRQTLPPAGMLGRVHGAYRMVSGAGMLAGAVLGGVVTAAFGVTAPFWAGLTGMTVALTYAWKRLAPPPDLKQEAGTRMG
jgi:MFS family permease